MLVEKRGEDDKVGDITFVELSLLPRDIENAKTFVDSDSDDDGDDEEQKGVTELSLSTDALAAAFSSGSVAEVALVKGVTWASLGNDDGVEKERHVRGSVQRIASNGMWVNVKTSEGGTFQLEGLC